MAGCRRAYVEGNLGVALVWPWDEVLRDGQLTEDALRERAECVGAFLAGADDKYLSVWVLEPYMTRERTAQVRLTGTTERLHDATLGSVRQVLRDVVLHGRRVRESQVFPYEPDKLAKIVFEYVR